MNLILNIIKGISLIFITFNISSLIIGLKDEDAEMVHKSISFIFVSAGMFLTPFIIRPIISTIIDTSSNITNTEVATIIAKETTTITEETTTITEETTTTLNPIDKIGIDSPNTSDDSLRISYSILIGFLIIGLIILCLIIGSSLYYKIISSEKHTLSYKCTNQLLNQFINENVIDISDRSINNILKEFELSNQLMILFFNELLELKKSKKQLYLNNFIDKQTGWLGLYVATKNDFIILPASDMKDCAYNFFKQIVETYDKYKIDTFRNPIEEVNKKFMLTIKVNDIELMNQLLKNYKPSSKLIQPIFTIEDDMKKLEKKYH